MRLASTGREDTADVVVIGAGAGGAAAAWALCEAGVAVTVLEAGPQYDPFSDYRLDQTLWETARFPDRAAYKLGYRIAPLQRLSNEFDGLRSWNHITGRFNRGERRRGWRYHHVIGAGGSTLHFSGEAQRLHPDSMRMHSRFGLGADWPLEYAELEPYYVRAEKLVGVAGPAEQGARWRSEAFPLPAHAPAFASTKLMAGGGKLGMHWQANSMAALSQPYDGRPGCNYCANCARGCPRTDKGSADVTFLRKAQQSGRCTLLTRAPVMRLLSGSDERVAGVEYRSSDGALHRLRARTVILACGAVESPRLLLLSRDARAPHGLGNEQGQVGRHFMETVFWTSSALHPEMLGSHRGLPADVACWDYNAPDAVPGTVGGCRFSSATAEADLIGPVNYAQRVVPGWGSAHKKAMRESFGRVLAVKAMGESLPNDSTYIALDPDHRDAYGRAVAHIHVRTGEHDLRRLQFMADRCRDVLHAAGCGAPFEEYGSYDMFSATHVFGGCRMGNDPNDSVVDPFGQSHRWRNLFVLDASVFPSTGGGESPSLTIEALAIRGAERLRDLLAARSI